MSYRYLPLRTVEQMVPLMEIYNVSAVARSRRGFLAAYRRARGRSATLKNELAFGRLETWHDRRENFIKRHLAQAKKNGEKWYHDGVPTRRHLALIAWAYSPQPRGIKYYVS